MGMGSYTFGSSVRIPLMISDAGLPYDGDANPMIEKIVRPDKTIVPGFPKQMLILDPMHATYYYDYTPDMSGDYIVIFCYTIDENVFCLYESFTVNPKVSKRFPRAEAK